MLRSSLSARRSRSAFTLLELVLGLSVAVVLMGALYVALRIQLRESQAARDVVQQSAVARSVFSRIAQETAAAVPAIRSLAVKTGSSGGGGGGGGGGASGGQGGASSAGSPGSTGSASSPSSSGTSSGSGSASSSSNSSSSSGSTTTYGPFSYGVQGDTEHLILYVSQWPHEISGASANGGAAPPIVGDQRRITYWLASEGGNVLGLARQEVTLVTSDDQMSTSPPDVPNPGSFVIGPEVKTATFRYFDGTTWQESWDGSQTGPDGSTPIGPPVAIEITLGIAMPGKAAGPDGQANLKTFRRVVPILAAPNPALASESSNSSSSSSQSNSSSGGS